MTFLRIAIPLQLLFEHDLFGKPVPTFPDHALFRRLVVDADDPALVAGVPGAKTQRIGAHPAIVAVA
jgi:hypothetical protein